MRRRDVLALGASFVGTLAARRTLAQDAASLPRAAVVIGVDRPGDLPPLSAAASGAHIFGDWLVDEGFEVRRVIDDRGPVLIRPIKDAVREFVNWPNITQLVIYFAGHGCMITGSERWLLSDAPDDPDAAINFASSYDLAQRFPIPNIVFISDTCRSSPDSLRMGGIGGNSIFPNPGGIWPQVVPKVDKFFATMIGDTASEVQVGDSVSNYEGIYTAVFLQAFKNPDQEMVLTLGSGLKVVPNRMLEDFLFREVRKRASERGRRQLPQSDIVSPPSTYIGRLAAASSAEAARPPEANLSDVVNAALAGVDPRLSTPRAGLSQASVDAIATELGFTEARDVILSASDPTAPRHGLNSGFTVTGAGVESISAAAGLQTEMLVSGDQTIIRAQFDGPAATAAIRFQDGTGTVVAGLRDFVGNIVVKDGLVSNISYDAFGDPPEDFVRRLRATVAAAAQLGIFRIRGHGEDRTTQATELGNTLRMGKFADPTLGLYAAYAYNEAALVEMVRSVEQYMRNDLNADLFDVAMLAGELTGSDLPDNVVPLCPMLSQGWNLLSVRDVHLPEILQKGTGLSAAGPLDYIRPAWNGSRHAGAAGADVAMKRTSMLYRRDMLKLSCATALAAAVPTHAHATPLKLIFVHGRGQGGLSPDELKATWLATLSEGADAIGKQVPVDLEIAFPYYGDTLDEFTRKSRLPLPSDIHSRGDASQDAFLDFQADMAKEIQLRTGITDAQISEEFDVETRERGPQNWEWVQAIVRAIDRHAPGLSRRSLETFMRDVYLYTTNFAVTDAIDAIVAKEFTRQPTIVVGHSLGSVVAYNVLKSHDNLNVPLYVSLGCPLGISTVTQQFRPVTYPGSVRVWYNAFDKRDVVALTPLDAANFPVTPPIENYDKVDNQTDNRHGIIGYLNDKTVAEQILNTAGT